MISDSSRKERMKDLSRCVSSLKSMTHAQKAKRLLENERISAEIVNLDKNLTRNGCAYGIAYDCMYTNDVRRILDRKGLGYGDVLGKEKST